MAITRTSSKFCRLPLLLALGLVGCGEGSPSPTAPSAPDTPSTEPDTPPPAVNAGALSFDGSNDRVTVPYSASFPTEVFTIAARVQLMPPPRRAAILARGEDNVSLNLSWQLYVLADGTLEIMLEDSSENNMCYPSNSCVPRGSCDALNPFVADSAWHHVAASRDSGGNLAVFVDGARRASCQGTGVPSANNRQVLTIGCTFGTIGPPAGGIQPPVWFFPGLIDEAAMWTRALGMPRSPRSPQTAWIRAPQVWSATGASMKAPVRLFPMTRLPETTASLARAQAPTMPIRAG